MQLRKKKTWKLWRFRKFEVRPWAYLKFFLYWSVASKKHVSWMKTRRQKQSKKHYTILPSHGIHQQSFIIHPRTSKRQSKRITQVFSSKAHMTIYFFSSQVQPFLQMRACGINTLKWGKPHGSTCILIGLIKISKLVLEALQSPRHKISHKISKKC